MEKEVSSSNFSWNIVKHKFAVAIYNFVPTCDDSPFFPTYLSILVGEEIIILEECSGWYRGYRHHHQSTMGIFPSSFVHLLDCFLINEGILCISVYVFFLMYSIIASIIFSSIIHAPTLYNVISNMLCIHLKWSIR